MEKPVPQSLQRRRVLAVAVALASTSLLAGCLGSDTPTDNGDDNTTSTGSHADDDQLDSISIDELATRNRRFAFDLYNDLHQANPAVNIFYSPHSISLALAMTLGGARDETADRMREVLHFLATDELHPAFSELTSALAERSQVDDNGDPFTLNIVNSIWGQSDYPFKDDFLTLLNEYYGATVRDVDFKTDPEGSRRTINAWVEDETADLIDELFPEGSITEFARLVLANVVYFHAAWASAFNPDATQRSNFTAIDGTSSTVDMMHQSGRFDYAEVDGHQIIELPYVGDDVTLTVILPDASVDFTAFESAIDVQTFDGYVDAVSTRDGTIALPRFEYEFGTSLKDVLSGMNMTIAFDPETADFRGIADVDETEEELFIHDIYHDAVISVDEEGTEAAAATGVIVGTTSAPSNPFEMIVDRPFIFAIRDRPTGTLLFLGRVIDID